jgi:hypothetical protein
MMDRRVESLFFVAALFVLGGCAQKLPVEKVEKRKIDYSRMMNYTDERKERYSLAPEPYSLASNEKDPELLGPQSTLQEHPLKESEDELLPPESAAETPGAEVVSELYDDNGDTKKREKKSSSMSRSECISIIGLAKFNQYSKKYGGEGAAIRRCIILKRLGG